MVRDRQPGAPPLLGTKKGRVVVFIFCSLGLAVHFTTSRAAVKNSLVLLGCWSMEGMGLGYGSDTCIHILTDSNSCRRFTPLQPLLPWRVMPEHPALLARLGKVHLHETKSDYSEFVGANCRKGSEHCFHWLSLLGPSSCVLLTAMPEAQVAATLSLINTSLLGCCVGVAHRGTYPAARPVWDPCCSAYAFPPLSALCLSQGGRR